MAKPSWCVKPSPCDYDQGSHYCPHRECRRNLEGMLVEAETKLDEMAPTHVSEDVDPQPGT